jgi:retron-type reverse transcriptase
MVKRFLRAGIHEDGHVKVSDEGTPQGGVISPLLANIYLHYALDLWFEKAYRKSFMGYARLIRYADDFVVCFQYRTGAERFHEELGKRLGKFGLEVEPTKTKVMEFGRFAVKPYGFRKAQSGDWRAQATTMYPARSPWPGNLPGHKGERGVYSLDTQRRRGWSQTISLLPC